jgi:hypothetical protein
LGASLKFTLRSKTLRGQNGTLNKIDMVSTIVGQLKPNEYDDDFYESQPIEIQYFNNIKVKIGFTDAEDENYLKSADRILNDFLQLDLNNKISDSQKVYDYYLEILKYGYTKPLKIDTAQDIWNFVSPIEIIIHWDESVDYYLCVDCNCEWEQEHGLQLVFKNGITLTRASGNDGHYED